MSRADFSMLVRDIVSGQDSLPPRIRFDARANVPPPPPFKTFDDVRAVGRRDTAAVVSRSSLDENSPVVSVRRTHERTSKTASATSASGPFDGDDGASSPSNGGCGPVVLAFAVVGFATALLLVCHVLREIAQGLAAHLLPPLLRGSADARTPLAAVYGKWAVVTGSTDGIGKEYARELAKRGLNIVLISRNIDKLNKISSEIVQDFKVDVKVIQADFSKGQIVFEHIAKKLDGIEIGILVNNVGTQYLYPMFVAELPETTVWDLVNVNVGATTHMTRLVLPGMQERKRGAIVNVSSSAELQPLPLMAVYAATKSYVQSFTEALRIECGEHNITVQHLFPLFVNTKMNAFSHRLQETSLFVPDAKAYATNAVNTLGVVNHSTGYWAHGIQYFFIRLPPVWIRTLIGEFLNHSFRNDYFSKKGLKVE